MEVVNRRHGIARQEAAVYASGIQRGAHVHEAGHELQVIQGLQNRKPGDCAQYIGA